MTLYILYLIQSAVGLATGRGAPTRDVFFLVISLLILTGLAGVFRKAKVPPPLAFVPILSEWTLLKIIPRPKWWILLMLAPLIAGILDPEGQFPLTGFSGPVAWATTVVVWVALSTRFRVGTGLTLGLVMLPFACVPYLGFGPDEYHELFQPRRRRRGPAFEGANGKGEGEIPLGR